MTGSTKLTMGQLHVMNLIRRDRDAEGWVKVSSTVMQIMPSMPTELVTYETLDAGGRARLTERGDQVLDARVYL